MRDSDEWIIREIRKWNPPEGSVPMYRIGDIFPWPEPTSRSEKDMAPRSLEECIDMVKHEHPSANKFWHLQIYNVNTGEIIPGELLER